MQPVSYIPDAVRGEDDANTEDHARQSWCTHPDSKSNGADHHRRAAVRFRPHLRLCPLVCQFNAPLFQGNNAALKIRLLIEHPAAV